MEAGTLRLGGRRAFLPQAARRARRATGFAASVACGVAVSLLALLGLLALTGHSVLIDRGDSMRPAIRAGDLVVTKRVHPSEVSAGEIVTFKDHTRGGELVTHRVAEKKPAGARYAFVTRGDANGGSSERWSIDADGTVGAYRMRVPKAGYVVSFFTRPEIRFVFITLCGLLLGAVTIRRIWSS